MAEVPPHQWLTLRSLGFPLRFVEIISSMIEQTYKNVNQQSRPFSIFQPHRIQVFPFLVLVSGASALTQSRGLVVIKVSGSTDTATTNDPLGTVERGSSSMRTPNCNLIVKSAIWEGNQGTCRQNLSSGASLKSFTSGVLRSTTESGITPFTAAATTSKHLFRSNRGNLSESKLWEVSFEAFNSVSSTPLLL